MELAGGLLGVLPAEQRRLLHGARLGEVLPGILPERVRGHSLSADALGIAACLYAYSHLSFLDSPTLAETCAEQYHLLRDYMLEQTEAEAILGAID